MNAFKKCVVSALMVVVIISGIFTPVPRANAFFGAEGWAILGEMIVEWLEQLTKWVEEEALKALRDVVVKQLIDKLTNDIVKSIANEGDPMFVQDWSEYMREAGDIAFNSLNEQLKEGGLNLCSPFAPQIRASLKYRLNNPYGNLPITCQFDDFKRNLQYTDNFIERGGWIAYDQMFIPSNNYYGLSILARDKYNEDVAREQEARKNDAISGSGYTSMRKCTKLGGGITQADIDEACDDGDNACRRHIEKLWCEKWQILNPGDVAATAVATAISGDAWWLTNVQSVVSALVNVFIKKVFDAARGGLTESSGSGGGSIAIDDVDTQDRIEEANERRLFEIKDRYNSFISYANNLLLLIAADLSLAQSHSGCSELVSYEDSDGIIQTTTITDLITFLTIAQQSLLQGLGEAQVSLAEIESLDYSDPDINNDIFRIVREYSDFARMYSVFIADLSVVQGGSPGALEATFFNIQTALQSLSCS